MKKQELTNKIDISEIEALLDYVGVDDLESLKTEDFRSELLKETITLTDYYANEMLTEENVLKLINYSYDIFNKALECSDKYIDGKKALMVTANPCYWDGEKVFFHSEETCSLSNIKNIELFKSLESDYKVSLLEAMTGLDQEFPPDYLCVFEYREDEYLLERDWSGDLEYYTIDDAMDEWINSDDNVIEESERVDYYSDDIKLLLELKGYEVVILERTRFLEHSHLNEIEEYLEEGYKLIRDVDIAYVEKAEEVKDWHDNEISMKIFVNNCLYTTLVRKAMK